MLTLVKLALRVTSNAFDSEIQLLIDSCLSEMASLGITNATAQSTDPQIKETVIAYCKWKFGDADNKAEWESIYHIKLKQLKTATGYTNWGDV